MAAAPSRAVVRWLRSKVGLIKARRECLGAAWALTVYAERFSASWVRLARRRCAGLQLPRFTDRRRRGQHRQRRSRHEWLDERSPDGGFAGSTVSAGGAGAGGMAGSPGASGSVASAGAAGTAIGGGGSASGGSSTGSGGAWPVGDPVAMATGKSPSPT